MAPSRGRLDGAPRGVLLRLTRRADQAHIDIVTEIIEPAPRDRQRVFHFHAAKFAKSVSIRTIDFAAF
jgi:hypothetical protein